MRTEENVTHHRATADAWRERNIDRVRAQDRARYHANPEPWRARVRARRLANPEEVRAAGCALTLAKRQDVLAHYGGRCACCGEAEERFLTVDHINGLALKGEITSGHKWTGRRLYLGIIREGYPDGVQVLCFNCNCGRALNNNMCPHKEQP